MKIKNISCTQFAGIRDKNIAFEDGINVIYGKNESGKSTLVNLISRTLFQNVKIDGRSNRDFCDLYFPAVIKNSDFRGDFIDGKISLETENGTYSLSKEWGTEARCTLSTPNGVLRNQSAIDEILKNVLVYGEGVYSEMLFSSQKNSDYALETLLDAAKKTEAKQEIANAVTTAFSESDGITVDGIEQAIDARIKEIEGEHWDYEQSVPKRKIGGGRHQKQQGETLKAYYELLDAEEALEKISTLETQADIKAKEYINAEADVKAEEIEYEKFNKFATRLALQSEKKSKLIKLEAEVSTYTKTLEIWPELEKSLKTARVLYKEKSDRATMDKYETAKALSDEKDEIVDTIGKIKCPEEEEILSVKNAIKNISRLENKLCGINITAQIKMLNNCDIEVKSLRTGEKININNENVSINEAVIISIPDIMEMQLSPADTDTVEITSQIDSYKKYINDIYKRYNVKNIDELDEINDNYKNLQNKLNMIQNRLSMLLDGMDFNKLKNIAQEIPANIRTNDVIDGDILKLCANADISRFIAEKETLIAKNESDYESMEKLREKVFVLSEELLKTRNELCENEDIPQEYLKISNPESYLENIKRTLNFKREKREKALSDKLSAVSALESYKDNSGDAAAENVENARRKFNEYKELLDNWKHIKYVFESKKNEISDNPLHDISEKFTRYLQIITNGRVESEFPLADKLNMNIYSENKLMDYGKLSEGTKETVSLAFRLAVLEHLFPNGGGVAVFDDPLTDMDTERSEKSCELIKEFSKNHQVIFLTCKNEYLQKLGGNHIIID